MTVDGDKCWTCINANAPSLCVMRLNLFSVFLLFIAALVDCDPCKFNRACDCQTSIVLTTTVHCYNVSGTFPIFTIYNATLIESISVVGSFNYVPANAFNALAFVPLGASITIGRSKFSPEPLFIDENAFQFVPIENLSFFFVTLPSVPTLALASKTLKNLNFESGKLEVINDYAFEGLTITDSLRFLNNGLRSVFPDGFTGLNSNGTVLKTFYSDSNPLNEVPQALKKLKIEEVYLLRSNISKLTDDSFCNSSSCATVKLDLTGNPINTISSYSFQNMPLKELSLYSTNLTTIPSALSQIGSSLVTLDLRSNKFTDISSTTTIFSSLRSLTSVNLDYNPIIKMSSYNNGWGSKPMTELQLSNLNSLESIDISFLSGMASFKKLTISTCPFLTSVLCSLCNNYYYMPANFSNLNLSGNDLRSLDSTFSTWLQQLQQKNATIDISYNYNYNCDTNISWMAKYVNCKPAKIIATETLCANTKLPLSIYLRSNYETVCS